jgi:hypothetical protein
MTSVRLGTTLAVLLLGLAGCGSDGSAHDAAALLWYRTCGAPICGPNTPDAGQGTCTSGQIVGLSCSMSGAMCDPGVGCGVMLLCTDKDPIGQAGCPIAIGREHL